MNPYPSTSSSHPPPAATLSARDPGSPANPVGSVLEHRAQTADANVAGNGYDDDGVRPIKRRRLEVEADGDNADGAVRVSSNQVTSTLSPTVTTVATDLVDNTTAGSGSGRPAWTFYGNEGPPAQTQTPGTASTKSLEENQQQPSSSSSSSAAAAASLPPFPARPWSRSHRIKGQASGSPCRTGTPVNNVQITPYALETPVDAPVFGSGKAGDFYPWHGSHPEDVLTEQTAKHGYFDHVQVSQNESNTARPSLYAHLKHRSGLKALSSVFTAALEKRHAEAKVSASSTFKPPPRVTLTDMKREAWLRDLANSAVPLRRLSRTIPHGIRGKSLLDQCMSKNIPIGRALWLAKCVGANEIRAFKRKGTSPAATSGLESKWVREWTVNVIQFLDSVVGGCGVEGWRGHLSYSMNLTARFFRDNLLDQDYFLEWLLSSLEDAPPDTLPVWLLIVRLFWPNLVCYRKRGRRLAECLLEKQQVTVASDTDGALRPLCQRLSSLIKGLALSQPSCFVLPDSWNKRENTLTSCLDLENPDIKTFFTHLSDRNARVRITLEHPKTPARSPSRQLIHLLDSAISNYRAELASECQLLQLDHATLVSTTLLWASTSFRSGLARVFIAARLLRKWNRSGIDTDAHILTFLANRAYLPRGPSTNLYHVIAELVLSRSFSVGRYLQRLMARGAVTQSTKQGCVPGDVELLAQIPSRRLPEHVWNLRNTLLERAGSSVSSETLLINNVKRYIQRQAPELCGTIETSTDVEMTEEVDFLSLSWTVRSEVSQYLRGAIASHFDGKSTNEGPDLSAEQFCQIRHVLECLEDLSVLADVLQHASHAEDSDVAVAALDTIIHHFDSLSAIGSITTLFKSYFAAYTRFARSQVPTLLLISSLLEIGIKLPGEASSVVALRRDLERLDRKGGIAAFSPVSDHMTDTLNPINAALPESLDQVLAPGNTIDEPTTVRIFEVLIQTILSSKPDSKPAPSEAATYLTRLRAMNSKLFDGLMLKWVVATVTSQARPKLAEFLPPLIGVGCITFQAFVALAQKLSRSDSKDEAIPDVAALRFEMLQMLSPESSMSHAALDTVSYRYKTAREEYVLLHRDSLLGFVDDALADTFSCDPSQARDHDRENVLKTCIVPLLCELIVKTSGRSEREPAPLILRDYPHCKGALQRVTGSLLGLESHNGIEAARETLKLIDDFSLSCGLVKLQLLCEAESDDESKQGVLDTVLEAAETDIKEGNHYWIDLMSILQTQAARQVRQRAEQALLALIPTKPTQPQPGNPQGSDASERDGLAYLSVIEELGWTIVGEETSSLPSGLLEKLNSLLQTVGMLQNNAQSAGQLGKPYVPEEHPGHKSRPVLFWFYALLRLVAMHRSTWSSTTASKADITDRCRLLLVLCCVSLSPLFSNGLDEPCRMLPHVSSPSKSLQQNLPPTWRTLRTYALDVASSVVDTLPDESRRNCARFLRERCSPHFHPHNNPHLLQILGPLDETQLPLSTEGGASTPTSTQPPNFFNTQAQTQPGSSSHSSNNATPPSATVEDLNSLTNRLQLQQGGRIVGPCPSRPWEMLEEAAPVLGENDTALNLAFFRATQARR